MSTLGQHVSIRDTEVLSSQRYALRKITFDYRKQDGTWETQTREVFDRGNGAAILLYNKAKGTVVLTRQFRMPTFLNGNSSGMLLEVCAGQLDADQPEACARREAEEETGYRVGEVRKVFEAYMSPGAVTEILYFFVAEYSKDMKVSEGGGHEHEQENIEVTELPFAQAVKMMESGQIRDGKTIMLLQYALLHRLLG
jgi:nudix-type nucleoside diphosphatase (YffH/AdpP family)